MDARVRRTYMHTSHLRWEQKPKHGAHPGSLGMKNSLGDFVDQKGSGVRNAAVLVCREVGFFWESCGCEHRRESTRTTKKPAISLALQGNWR